LYGFFLLKLNVLFRYMDFLEEEYNYKEEKTNLCLKKRKKKWYAIYTKARSEKRVYDRMIKEGIEVFLPLETTVRQWSDRKKKVKIPYIKSYVFVRTEENTIFRKVLKISGTVMVLKHLGKPAIVKDYEINNLRILMDNDANFVTLDSIHNIEIGDDVEIESGSFMGLKGKCVRVNGKKSVLVELSVLGLFQSVEVPAKYLKC